jgi:hypothetical protein
MSINEGSCQRLARPGGFDPRIRRFEDPYRRFLHHALVDDIFSQVPTEYKQKHTAPEYSENFVKCGIGVIFLIKNPYSWVLSMYNRPYGLLLPKPDNFSRFLRNPWLGLRRDNVPSVLSCPLELWNRKLASYCCFAEFAKRDGLPLLFLKFEEFVADQLEALSKIRFVFGVTTHPCPLRQLASQSRWPASAPLSPARSGRRSRPGRKVGTHFVGEGMLAHIFSLTSEDSSDSTSGCIVRNSLSYPTKS